MRDMAILFKPASSLCDLRLRIFSVIWTLDKSSALGYTISEKGREGKEYALPPG